MTTEQAVVAEIGRGAKRAAAREQAKARHPAAAPEQPDSSQAQGDTQTPTAAVGPTNNGEEPKAKKEPEPKPVDPTRLTAAGRSQLKQALAEHILRFDVEPLRAGSEKFPALKGINADVLAEMAIKQASYVLYGRPQPPAPKEK